MDRPVVFWTPATSEAPVALRGECIHVRVTPEFRTMTIDQRLAVEKLLCQLRDALASADSVPG